jgi:glycosyltransferase involved in cell wall biosynthesis
MTTFSFIVPVYNEEESILPFYMEILKVAEAEFELIWVNDGSTDKTIHEILKLTGKDDRLKCISFSRNFGHQAALMAGLHFAKGKYIVMMDGDLQHPPGLIPLMLQKLNEGYDLVSAKRKITGEIRWWKKIITRIYYLLINFLSDTPIEENVADFRAFNRKIAEAILMFEERELFLRGIFSWIGFASTTIDYNAPARPFGNTKYSFIRMVRLGLKGTLSFSFKPIRLSLLLGAVVSIMAFFFALFAIIAYFRGQTIPGWTSIIIAIMLLSGIQLIMIGLIGEYIASLYSEVKKRPLFIIDEKINLEKT